MKVALIGYGRMGKEIEKVLQERGHEVPLIIDVDNQHEFTKENLKQVDAAIEFTLPETAFQNIMTCIEAGTPVVSGTTGWLGKYEEIVKACEKYQGTFFYAPNYSLGVNILFKMNQYLAQIMDQFDQYEAEIEETHHIQKVDSPSGTAIKLAEQMIEKIKRKKDWKEDAQDKNGIVNIHAVREDQVPGIHTITYKSDIDSISIKHSAKNRKGLSQGAVMAAEFIKDKQGIFTMDDLLNL